MRRRLDVELVRRDLVGSRTAAQEAVEAGLVTIDGAPAFKAATLVAPGADLVVRAPPRRFVSRGGEKLDHGLERFAVDVGGRSVLDAGASTGGFTDCLLQRGAGHVVAVDVGYGQLHDRLRRDERVTVVERTNVRDLTSGTLPGTPLDLVVADLSFISLELVLPVLRSLVAPTAPAVVLVKPQFEAGREQVGAGGVVRDPAVWTAVLRAVADAAAPLGWHGFDVTASPLLGPAGNVEFLAHLRSDAPTPDELVDARIAAAVDEGTARRG